MRASPDPRAACETTHVTRANLRQHETVTAPRTPDEPREASALLTLDAPLQPDGPPW